MGQLGDYTGRDSNIPVRVGDEGFSSLEIYGYLSNLGVSTGSAVSLDKTVEMRDDQQLIILMADPSAFDIDKGFNLHQHISAGTLEDGVTSLRWTGEGEVFQVFQSNVNSAQGAAGSVLLASTRERAISLEGDLSRLTVRAGWKKRGVSNALFLLLL